MDQCGGTAGHQLNMCFNGRNAKEFLLLEAFMNCSSPLQRPSTLQYVETIVAIVTKVHTHRELYSPLNGSTQIKGTRNRTTKKRT